MFEGFEKRRLFVFSEPIDMRSGFEALSHRVKTKMEQEILDGDIYLFLGNNRGRLKLLMFDGTGLVLVTKRLEKGHFQRVLDFSECDFELSHRDFAFVFSGSHVNFQYRRGESKIVGAASFQSVRP
jgi:transposase